MKYHSLFIRYLTRSHKLAREQCLGVSLTGAVSSQKVTEDREGHLRPVGNRSSSAWVKDGLTVRPTSRADTKVGPSDPVVSRGTAIA